MLSRGPVLLRSRLGLQLALLLAVAGACSRSGFAQPSAAAKVALLVGVNQYEKRYLAERPLQFAERDVEHMAQELGNQGFTVKLLKGSLTGADKATRSNIEAALAELLTGRSSTDIVLIGFAGHGQQLPLRNEKGEVLTDSAGRQMEEAYYCPVDATFTEATSMVGLTTLVQTLDVKGGINLVLVDACRDNPDTSRGIRSISGNELNGRLPRNTALMFSCSAGQQALETEKAGGGHGVFFHHVLQGLQGEAKNARGEVTWSRLVEFVTDNTDPQAKEWFPERAERAVNGRVQTPHRLENLTVNPVLAKYAIAPVVIPRVNPQPTNPNPNPPQNSPPSGGGDLSAEFSNRIGMKMKLIPAGEFLMGSPTSEANRNEDEGPQHRVKISQPYYLGMHEVTKGQFARFVAATNYRTDAEKDGEGSQGWNESVKKIEIDPKFTWRNAGHPQEDDHPVVAVSWNDAMAFCKWLSAQEEKTYTLPTEAQWEYACRAGNGNEYFFGENPELLAEYANVADGTWRATFTNWPEAITAKDGHVFTAPVGSFRPNTFGLHDMHGNVWEWCLDGYDENSYKNLGELTQDPMGTNTIDRVIRGGSWGSLSRLARSADRRRMSTDDRSCYYGFRVAMIPQPVNPGPKLPQNSPPSNGNGAGGNPENNSPPLFDATMGRSEADAQAAQQAWARHIGQRVEIKNSINMKLTLIPPGVFMMGSPDSEIDAILAKVPEAKREDYKDEQPQHRAHISQPYYLGSFEVTQAEFQAVMGRNPSEFKAGATFSKDVAGLDTKDFPVDNVSWFDAIEFCNRLSEKHGLATYYSMQNIKRKLNSETIDEALVDSKGGDGYRLPTEAEWEFACRAGTLTAYHFGNAFDGLKANIDGRTLIGAEMQGPFLGRPTNVGSYRANAFGLFDMHGNVKEYCFDVHNGLAYQMRDEFEKKYQSENIDPVFKRGDSLYEGVKVVRGGDHDSKVRARSAYRPYSSASGGDGWTGFRIAKSVK